MKIAFLFFFLSSILLLSYQEEPLFIKTEQGYQQIISALSEKEPQYREEKLNKSLQAYFEVLREKPIGELFANVGIAQFYLGNRGLSLFYLKKASYLDPRNREIKEKLRAVQIATEIEGREIPPSFIQTLFSGSSMLSPSEKNGITIGIAALVTLLISLKIWMGSVYGLHCAIYLSLSLLSSTLLFFSIIPAFFTNPRAIVQQSVTLKGSYNEQIVLSDILTLLPGEEVEILSMNRNQEWLYVRTFRNKKGYLPGSILRIYK